jgi:tetratricopeptide (TPR) repeat protein
MASRGPGRTAAVLLPLLFLFSAFLLNADVIYLKNGRKLVAQVTREDDKQVFYGVSGGELALPKSMVDHIEKSDAPAAEPRAGGARSGREIPPPLSALPDVNVEEGSAVIHDGAVDEAYLSNLNNEVIHKSSPENVRRLKQAYQQAAVFLTRKGESEAAIQKYGEALKYVPHDQALTLGLGYLLWKQEHYLEAVDLLLPETDRYPKAPDFFALLGSAYYGMDNLDQAIAEWNKALEIHDNPGLRAAVEKAQREREVSGSYYELRSEHFLLRYEGQSVERLSGEILNSLEGSFQNLVLDLDYSPTEVIVVVIYPSQSFRDITRSPSWVGALNDGKIRVPISGLSVMTADLARVLKHELTHSFVRQITLGHCPNWFNEGLAQLEEGATTTGLGSQLARGMAAGKIPAFAALEDSFMGMASEQAGFAYAKCLAALEYLRDSFGMGEVRRMLRLMPSVDFNTILQDEIRESYPAFEVEVSTYVAKKYGS